MKKLSLKKIAKMPSNKIFEGMPKELTDPKMYDKIERELLKILKTDHKHKTVKEYVTCAWCNKRRELRQNKIKSYGFQSIEQYMMWRKVHEIMKNKKNIVI